MEYIKIGEIFEYNGEWYQCVKGDICADCAFAKKHCNENPLFEAIGSCSKFYRKDATSVIFKKLEKVGEPYSCNYYGDNRFRTIAKAKEHLFQATNIAEDKKELDVLDSFLLRCWQMGWLKQYEDAKEKHLKSFNLEAAKSGKPVFTRDGRKARIICFDRKDNTPIVALIECGNGAEILQCYFNNGKCYHDATSDYDLMMLPEKKEGWVNVYKSEFDDFPAVLGAGYVYNTKEEAIKNADFDITIATVKIEWEE